MRVNGGLCCHQGPCVKRRGVQVVAKDYPTPKLEGTAMYTEASNLSASLRNAPRPERPLKIIIAGAGICLFTKLPFLLLLLITPRSVR